MARLRLPGARITTPEEPVPVLVDHRTGQDAGPVAAYKTQLGVYARAIADATDEPVVRSVLLFLRPDGALAETIDSRGTT